MPCSDLIHGCWIIAPPLSSSLPLSPTHPLPLPHSARAQLARAVLLCAKRCERRGTLPRLTPYVWIGHVLRMMRMHGFARNAVWSVHRSCADVNPDYPEPCVTLRLADSGATRAMWAHAFEALLEVTLKRDSLKLDFRVRNANAGGEAFDFTAALHSYFEVVDAAPTSAGCSGFRFASSCANAVRASATSCPSVTRSTLSTPITSLNTASVHQKQPPASVT